MPGHSSIRKRTSPRPGTGRSRSTRWSGPFLLETRIARILIDYFTSSQPERCTLVTHHGRYGPVFLLPDGSGYASCSRLLRNCADTPATAV